MAARDDFNIQVVRELASRVGHRCSNPACRRDTSGPTEVPEGSVSIGVAAHITAAAPGGPRYDAGLGSQQRVAAANGIWLCQTCSRLIDRDVARYTKEVLALWKSDAETRAKSLLETPARPEHPTEPLLFVPSTSASASWLPFSSRATTLVGRELEQQEIRAFLNDNRRFLWWVIVGAAGTGKSRLALETCHQLATGWHAGFHSRADEGIRWAHFRPSTPTLIVIDYAVSRAYETSAMLLHLARSVAHLPHPVRVLVLERDLGTWWSTLQREDSQSENAQLLACQYKEPLHVAGLSSEALLAIAREVASSRGMKWNADMERAFVARMRVVDPLDRPLFGMMTAAFLEPSDCAEAIVDVTLLRRVLTKEKARRRTATVDVDRFRRIENLLVLCTLVGGLVPQSGSFGYLAHVDASPLLPDSATLDIAGHRGLAGGFSDDVNLPGLQPDILGERMVLDAFASKEESRDVVRRLLLAAWSLQPAGLCDFIIRSASDFPGDEAIAMLCDLPLETAEARFQWGRLVGELVRVSAASNDPLASRLLGSLRQLADSFPMEGKLRNATAMAELYLGNTQFFVERNGSGAVEQYETAIKRAGATSQIAAAAINNRGIVHSATEKEDQAVADWTAVIENEEYADEVRACAMNNRADVWAERGDYARSIQDRDRVLALRDTTPDRRFIALFRRSRSLVAVGESDKAVLDLESIQSTPDISAEQKAQASVEKGVIYLGDQRIAKARQEFDEVLGSEHLFPGTAEAALVGLAELARAERDNERSLQLIDEAVGSSHIRDGTLVTALVVRARVLEAQAKRVEADETWQAIKSHPVATPSQKAVAARRGQ